MKKSVYLLTAALFILLAAKTNCFAQKCKLSYNNRPIIATVQIIEARTQSNSDFTGSFGRLLHNEIENSDCFRSVSENDIQESARQLGKPITSSVDNATIAILGQESGASASMVITIHKFEEKKGPSLFTGDHGNLETNKATVSFTLRLIDTNTGLPIGTKTFEESSTKAGIGGVNIEGYNMPNLGFKSKAMKSCLDDCMDSILKWVGSYQTQISAIKVKKVENMEKLTASEVNISNISFTQLNTLYNHLKSQTSIKNLTKSFSNNTATLKIDHIGTIDDIATLIDGTSTGVTINITNLEGKKLTAVVK